MDLSKLLSHPDQEEIISKLVNGVKPKDVSDWLKIKYPNKDQNHLRLSIKLLKEFLDKHLDLYNTLEKDLKSAKSSFQEKQVAASLKNNKTYQERISEIANTEVDIKKMMVETGELIRARIEQYFDKVQENPSNLKPDYGLIKWFELLLSFTEKYDKIVNNSPDQIVQHNVTFQVVDQYVAVLQDCIRETLAEMDPEAAALFMEKYTEKIMKVQPPDSMMPQQSLPQNKRLAEAKILSSIGENVDDINEINFPPPVEQ